MRYLHYIGNTELVPGSNKLYELVPMCTYKSVTLFPYDIL